MTRWKRTGRHHNRRRNHQLLAPAAEQAQQPQHHAGTRQDTEADRQPSQADSDRVMAVRVVRLRRPEHDEGEEVGAGNEGDDKRQGQGTRGLLQPTGKHGEPGELDLPHDKGDDERDPEEKGNEHVG